ncbi:MAG: hypothetical protein M3379_09490, partial [Acidobacteriota bacterium]|nr:hypothetical protein [Acidobacteriota bacterium]
MPFLARPVRAASAPRAFRLSRISISSLLPALPLLCVAALSLALVLLPPGAKAATVWHVTPGSTGACTQADPNCGSIQAAVNAASAGDTIQVAAGTYVEHVTISKDLTISGAGAAQTIVDGTQSGTVLTINSGTVSLSGMSVINGKASTNGGGISNLGTLNVTNSTVSNNSAVQGGGIYNNGTLNLTGSTVSNNSVTRIFGAPDTGNGAGIFNDTAGALNVTSSIISNNSSGGAGGWGGGIFNKGGPANVTDSAVSGNSAGTGGGIFNGGTLNVKGSTVSNNSAPGNSLGGGIFNDVGRTLTVTDCTISNNSAGHGGGIDTNVNTTLTIISSTISGNASTISAGGGISNGGGDGSLQLRSSIVAGNTSPDSPDISGGAISQGHNLIGISDGSKGLSNGTNGDIVGTSAAPVNAKLSPLGFYGGPTQTQLPLCGSPAIDAGDDALTGAPLNLTTDQRGVARKSGAHVDIGAVERQQGVQINSQDSGPGSLRQLIADAQDGAVIDLDCASAATVTLTSDELLINKNLIINGPGPSLLTVQRSAAQGTAQFRIFEVAAGKSFSLSDVTISNGKPSTVGGGIFNDNGTMNVSNVVVSNNSAVQGGGIFSQGTLTVTNSTFSSNSNFGFGGEGGGIYNGGTLTVTNSSFSNNSAGFGGGAIFHNFGTANVTGSTVSNNSVTDSTGGKGGGIYNNAGPLTLTNSTVSGNSVTNGVGGGIFNDFGPTTVISSTISNNSASGGGGIQNTSSSSGTVSVRSSIVAGNTASSSNSGPDVAGQFASQGHNLVGKSDGSTGFANGTNGDIVGTASAPVDAMLRPLGFYGGPTQTQMPRPTSPVIDAGD